MFLKIVSLLSFISDKLLKRDLSKYEKYNHHYVVLNHHHNVHHLSLP